MTPRLSLYGYASGIAANNQDCALGPWYLFYHPELFTTLPIAIIWQTIINNNSVVRDLAALPSVAHSCSELGHALLPDIYNQILFCVIGGDHSSAIGTWSAFAYANRTQGDIGLLWLDAHMDSHTPSTSTSHHIHGMPLAHLLGKGDERLGVLFNSEIKLKPCNVCLIGIRSFEPEEAQLLASLGVRIYLMAEVKARGLTVILDEASALITKNTCCFGITIDLDVIDPIDAPGVGCPEAGGILGPELVNALSSMKNKTLLKGLEITEYNPILDTHGKTAQLVVDLIGAVIHSD